MKTKFILTIIGIFLIGNSLFAQTITDRRQVAQHVRIAEGRKDGDLTRGETVRLRKEQRNIRRTERRVKADGTVTPREKARLAHRQNRASRHIHRAKNNSIDNK